MDILIYYLQEFNFSYFEIFLDIQNVESNQLYFFVVEKFSKAMLTLQIHNLVFNLVALFNTRLTNFIFRNYF